METKKVVLAYSGGLDTSVILHWLCVQGYEVHCFMADVGQPEDFDTAQKKALSIGATSVHCADLKQEFVEQYIFKALKANAVYEGVYLLGTSLARPFIAQKHVEYAQKCGITALAHGATGKGNDQVRFELTYACLMPEATVIVPWRDPEFLAQFKGRTDLIAYAKKHGIAITSTLEKPYSVDENLMHMSYESGMLEDPAHAPNETMFKMTQSLDNTPDDSTLITIEFKQGIPVAVTDKKTGKTISGAVPLITYLNELGGMHGIGRVDMVENRCVGLKSRGVYEAPGATILWKAHRDLEGLVLDREVAHAKDALAPVIAKLIYNGLWFSPELGFYQAAIEQSQKNVTGTVFVKLFKGNVIIAGRQSPFALYQKSLASMDEIGEYNPADAQGFIKLNALRLQASHKQQKGNS